MRIKPEEVIKVARLARLTLTEEETRQYTQEFDDILGHFAVIDGYKLTNETCAPANVPPVQPLRQDQPELFADQGKLQQNVKALKDGLIVVPKILE